MKTMILFSMLAALTMLAPTGVALALPDTSDCTQPGLAQRVRCTVDATVAAVEPVIEPAKKLVEYEVGWASGVVFGLVDDACHHVTGKPCYIAVAPIGVDAQLLA